MQKRTPQFGAPRGPAPAAMRNTPWRAVSIVTGRWCCEAAHNLPPIRYLSKEAPRLPLPQCNSPDSCSCLYKHHLDRRGQPRRKGDRLGIHGGMYGPQERRVSRGRRADD